MEDWPSCASLRVTPTKGRHLVADIDLPAGTTIIDARAFAAAVYDEYAEHVCGYCFKVDEYKPFEVVCTACKRAWYCSEHCRRQHLRDADCGVPHELTCCALRLMEPLKNLGSLIKPRLMIEVLAKRYHLKVHNEHEFLALQYDRPEEGWPPSEEVNEWCDSLRTALSECGWSADVPPEAVSNDALISMASQIDANGFDCLTCTTSGDSIGIGIYLNGATFLNHSCQANCEQIHRMPRLVIKTTRAVDKGEPLCIAYVDVCAYADVAERRERLRDSYGFECDCALCCAQQADEIDRQQAVASAAFLHVLFSHQGARQWLIAAVLAGLGYILSSIISASMS